MPYVQNLGNWYLMDYETQTVCVEGPVTITTNVILCNYNVGAKYDGDLQLFWYYDPDQNQSGIWIASTSLPLKNIAQSNGALVWQDIGALNGGGNPQNPVSSSSMSSVLFLMEYWSTYFVFNGNLQVDEGNPSLFNRTSPPTAGTQVSLLTPEKGTSPATLPLTARWILSPAPVPS